MDWIQFFEDHGIDYTLRGPNVAKGNANIACPMCGDDPSHHMGVSLSSEKYGCWRSVSHSGLKAHNLIKGILGCSFNQARLIADQYKRSDPDKLDDVLEALVQHDSRTTRAEVAKVLHWPKQFRDISDRGSTRRFYDYLKGRRFSPVDKFVKKYQIKCALTGTYQDRVILPILKDKKLLSWTSRAITNPKNAPRYLALSDKPGKEGGGLVNVFHTLINQDFLKKGGDLLVVCEGPLDALKVDFYGYKYGIRGTCTFGTAMTETQAGMILRYARKFERTILLYDQNATESIFLASDKLLHGNVETVSLPDDLKDPGEFTRSSFQKFFKQFVNI